MIIRWPKSYPAPANYKSGTVKEEVVSLIDLTPTTLGFAGIDKPYGMHGRIFLGNQVGPERTYAFSARDRVDETVNRVRSVRGKKYHYIRNYFPDRHFTSLNRYKEKCFPIKPLMRRLMAEGKLSGPPADLMATQVAPEQLFDTETDPHEINNLATSKSLNTVRLCLRCAPLWMFGLWRHRTVENFPNLMRLSLLSTRKCTIGLVPLNGIKINI